MFLRKVAPFAVRNQPSAKQLKTTAAQNPVWNSFFVDLCRNIFCASKAPGQPPTIPNTCSVLSRILQRLFCAADLSIAYARKASMPAAKYNPRIANGSRPVNTATARIEQNRMANTVPDDHCLPGAVEIACCLTNRIVSARNRPFSSVASS